LIQRDKDFPVVAGIHHVTAIAGDPQKNFDFYKKILGIRFVKKTVNFDDPNTYHFYFGNETGEPGTIITFFPWSELAYKGRKGAGQATTISFSIPADSMSYWFDRLSKFNIPCSGPFKRFDEDVVLLEDPDGIELELITGESKLPVGWTDGSIPIEHSIRGLHSVTLSLNNFKGTDEVLVNMLGFSKLKQEQNRTRYAAGNGIGKYIDILHLTESMQGTMGVGIIHHIAFRTDNEESQLKIRTMLLKNKIKVTPVIDRTYFKSIYFHEPGNILFEVATDIPGFLIDENISTLGKELKLPPQYEKDRIYIERALPVLKTE
jgi:glyoxalase family protein